MTGNRAAGPSPLVVGNASKSGFGQASVYDPEGIAPTVMDNHG